VFYGNIHAKKVLRIVIVAVPPFHGGGHTRLRGPTSKHRGAQPVQASAIRVPGYAVGPGEVKRLPRVAGVAGASRPEPHTEPPRGAREGASSRGGTKSRPPDCMWKGLGREHITLRVPRDFTPQARHKIRDSKFGPRDTPSRPSGLPQATPFPSQCD